jgi:hypothetical protein
MLALSKTKVQSTCLGDKETHCASAEGAMSARHRATARGIYNVSTWRCCAAAITCTDPHPLHSVNACQLCNTWNSTIIMALQDHNMQRHVLHISDSMRQAAVIIAPCSHAERQIAARHTFVDDNFILIKALARKSHLCQITPFITLCNREQAWL